MKRLLVWMPVLLSTGGCATFQRQPLDEATVEEALRAVLVDSVSVLAERLGNPLLPSVRYDSSDGLSPDEAALLAVVANPDLRAERARRGVARAELIAAGVLPNPQLGASADIPVRDKGASTATSLGLSIDFNVFFTRGAEVNASRAREESVRLDVAWQEWQVAQEARLQSYRQIFLERQHDLARVEADELRSNHERLEQAATGHLVTEVERAAAADAYHSARDVALQLEGELESARLGLNRTLGFPPTTSLVVQTTDVPFLPPPGSGDGREASPEPPALLTELAIVTDEELLSGLQRRRLDLAALRLGYESQEQSLRAAVLRRFPRINLGVNRVVDTSKLLTLGPAITLDLPFFDRNQGEVASARASREQLRAEYLARVFAARADLVELRQQIGNVRRRLDNAEESLPEVQHLVDVYESALKLRAVDALLYYDARARRTERQLEVLRLRQDLAELMVGVETATGGSWSSATEEGDR
ncbi:MAG: TolC family protein [bacterium]